MKEIQVEFKKIIKSEKKMMYIEIATNYVQCVIVYIKAFGLQLDTYTMLHALCAKAHNKWKMRTILVHPHMINKMFNVYVHGTQGWFIVSSLTAIYTWKERDYDQISCVTRVLTFSQP